eukprot:10053192-Lingulodinium_polyedra.AAC.1
MYAGIVRSARKGEGFVNIEKLKWQKSHVKLEELSGEAWLAAKANEQADSVAKEAVQLRPQWTEAMREALKEEAEGSRDFF